MHVAKARITKANVCPYYGREIPNHAELGLDPDKVYRMYRHPDELRAAADTFNGIQLLSDHAPVSVADPKEDLIAGTTGTDAAFDGKYLTNSLTIWRGEDIADIENEEKRELSCSYRYDPDMTPGNVNGEAYDGVMRNIKGNHVALVKAGRAGPDVMVGDSALTNDALTTEKRDDLEDSDFAVPGKRKLPIENPKHVKLAWDLLDDTDGLSSEEKAEARKRILAAAKRHGIDVSDWKGAKDSATPSNKGKLTMAAASRKARVDARITALAPFLASDADKEELRAALDAEETEREEEEKKAADKRAKDKAARDAKRAKDAKAAKDAEEDDDKDDDKADDEDRDDDDDDDDNVRDRAKDRAMDAAITSALTAERARSRAAVEARIAVRPIVGDVAPTMDSAGDIYRFALSQAGIDAKNIHDSALPAMVKLAMDRQSPAPVLALDSANGNAGGNKFAHLYAHIRRAG